MTRKIHLTAKVPNNARAQTLYFGISTGVLGSLEVQPERYRSRASDDEDLVRACRGSTRRAREASWD